MERNFKFDIRLEMIKAAADDCRMTKVGDLIQGRHTISSIGAKEKTKFVGGVEKIRSGIVNWHEG